MGKELTELEALHEHKTEISGFRNERQCRTGPSSSGDHIAIKYRKESGQAFIGGLVNSTSFSCPFGYLSLRARRKADTAYILKAHEASGGIILSGSFGMKVRAANAPKYFYHPKETFKESSIWERNFKVEKGEKDEQGNKKRTPSIHETIRTPEFQKFLRDNRDTPSYDKWDLNRRLNAASSGTSHIFTARDLGRLMKRQQLDLAGYIVATEIEAKPGLNSTTGEIGWASSHNNVHIHFLLLLNNTKITKKTVRALLTTLHARWKQAVKPFGFSSTLAGSQLKKITYDTGTVERVSAYISKGVKSYDDATRLGGSFWDALRDSKDGDKVARTWFRNFEGATRNRRLFRISKSLHDKYGVVKERNRRIALWQEKQGKPQAVAYIDRSDWFLKTKEDPELKANILRAAKDNGADGVREFLEAKQLPFHLEQGESIPTSDSWLLRQAGMA